MLSNRFNDEGTYVPGQMLGNAYEIVRELGEGGFGRVFLCQNHGGQLAAAKMLRRERLGDPEAVAMMRREIQRWVELGNHPNIVMAFGLFDHARQPCLLMEYVQGGHDLAAVLQRQGPQSAKFALRVGLHVATALAYGWERNGLVHRDLKPSNLLLAPGNNVKVADFGLSLSQLTEREPANAWHFGTPPYSAPETWSGTPAYGAASDIYALGVTLFQLMSGRLPIMPADPADPAHWAAAHQRDVPPHLHDLNKDVPPVVSWLVGECLRKSPGQRPVGFAALRDQIAEIYAALYREEPPTTKEQVELRDADALVNQSVMYHQLGEAAAALASAEAAVELAPLHAGAWLSLGNAQELGGDQARAWESFLRAEQLVAAGSATAEEVKAAGALARCAHKAGDRTRAESWLRRAMQRCAGDVAWGELDNVSDVVIELLPPEEAMRALDRILAVRPAAAITWNNRAILARRQGDAVAALASAERAAALNPAYAKAWTNCANALFMLERFADCRRAAQRALEIDPDLPGAYSVLAGALGQLDDPAQAEATLLAGLARLPDHPLLLRNLRLLRQGRA